MSILILPYTTADFDAQVVAIDAAILSAAQNWSFTYVSASVPYQLQQTIPDVVYKLIDHYRSRGFSCLYNGDTPTLTIRWDYPNMTDSEFALVTRAIPSMIPHLGGYFQASLLYLCITEGVDLRSLTVKEYEIALSDTIQSAATLGANTITFTPHGAPHQAFEVLYAELFSDLEESGFGVSYDGTTNLYTVSWDIGTSIIMTAGEVLNAVIS